MGCLEGLASWPSPQAGIMTTPSPSQSLLEVEVAETELQVAILEVTGDRSVMGS